MIKTYSLKDETVQWIKDFAEKNAYKENAVIEIAINELKKKVSKNEQK